jgi:hypothetical protein
MNHNNHVKFISCMNFTSYNPDMNQNNHVWFISCMNVTLYNPDMNRILLMHIVYDSYNVWTSHYIIMIWTLYYSYISCMINTHIWKLTLYDHTLFIHANASLVQDPCTFMHCSWQIHVLFVHDCWVWVLKK